MNCGVYSLTNKVTGRSYIGSSINLKSRIATWATKLNYPEYCNGLLRQDLLKHGAYSFEIKILEYCKEGDLVTLAKLENKYIRSTKKKYNVNKARLIDHVRGKRDTRLVEPLPIRQTTRSINRNRVLDIVMKLRENDPSFLFRKYATQEKLIRNHYKREEAATNRAI